jgi:P27 family predicted phage terminase small subunit
MRKTSDELKLALGTYRADRARKTPEFKSAGADTRPPAYLRGNRLALAEWKRICPILRAEGVLKTTDLNTLGSYCELFSRWRTAADRVAAEGAVILIESTTRTGKTQKPIVNPWCKLEQSYGADMRRVAAKLGLNPTDRSRVLADPFTKAQQAAAAAEAANAADNAAFDAELIDLSKQ